jgi:hypothetical protein
MRPKERAMSDQPQSPTPSPDPQRPNINIQAGDDLNAGTFVGGNLTTTATTNTAIGFNASQVQRLIITVAVLIFVTAGCFFSGGLALGVGALAALNSQAFASSMEAAQSFQSKLEDLRSLSPGQAFVFNFTEDELSSYIKFILGPQIGFAPETGKARLLEPGQLVIGGELVSLGNVPVAATFEVTNEVGAPLKLKGAAVQVLKLGDSPFGWMAVPTVVLQDVETNINQLFGPVQLQQVVDDSTQATNAWSVTGVSH